MRFLFSCTASEGHFRPLVPLARACVDAGHDVAFATAGSFGDRVESAGFRVLAAGMDQAELKVRHEPYRRELLSMPPNERRPYGFSSRFALIDAPAKLADLRLAAGDWQPDLIVHESADLAAPLVAATLGVPSVHHSFGRLVPRACYERSAEATDVLWQSQGLDPEPLCGAFRGRYIDICPPSLQSESVPAGVPVLRLRPTEPEDVSGASIPWHIRRPERPIVYVTLGTSFNDPSIFRLLLDALAGLDCNVLATIGRGNDPASLEPLPENAVVERYIPQAQVLPHANLVVGHGGSGSTLGALAHGLPQLLLPQGADQFENANACRAAGAARMLMPDQLTVAAARTEIDLLFDDPSYGQRAMEIAAEIAAMPSAADVVPFLLGG
ncbi:MAG: nucleotide disphospho-sugar-binding domain-containing protein [Gaiellaceae bacterium]